MLIALRDDSRIISAVQMDIVLKTIGGKKRPVICYLVGNDFGEAAAERASVQAKRTEKDTFNKNFNNKISRGQNISSMRSRDTFHIVVTDINHNVRDFLQRELEKEGYTVTSVKTGIIAHERISSTLPLDLIILDPELFHGFDESLIEKIVHQRPSLQILIHTFADLIPTIQPGNNVHLVEKDGQSIGAIKSIIHTCFTRFQENSTS